MKDRTIYLTNVVVVALRDYLKERGAGHRDHVFLYRHKPLNKGLIHSRLKAAGERTGVKVTAHRLRHTCATQLVNAGCPITTIQSVLGHRQLSATLVYARVHDRTVAEDYYAAMAVIEERLAAHLNQKPGQQSQTNGQHPGVNGNAVKLLRLVSALQGGSLSEEQRAVVTELQQELLSLAD